jgi:hypothetical protein
MQWLADARLVVGYAPSRTGPTAAAALGLVRKESRVLDVPVAAHLPVAPEMDPGSSERRYVRGIEALTAMVEAGEALLPPALQQEFLDCFAFCDWSRVRVCVTGGVHPPSWGCCWALWCLRVRWRGGTCTLRVCVCVCVCVCVYMCVHVC